MGRGLPKSWCVSPRKLGGRTLPKLWSVHPPTGVVGRRPSSTQTQPYCVLLGVAGRSAVLLAELR